MSDVIYRTAGAWGPGLGADLTAAQVDMNFWVLYSLIVALQDAEPITIAYFTITGNQIWITMTDHYVFGPYTIPQAVWNFRGPWQPNVTYNVNDVIAVGNAIYLVIFAHISQATFSPYANDGDGHNYYALLLASPFAAGTIGQVLAWQELPEGYYPTNLTRNVAIFVEGAVETDERLLQYLVPETMTLPLHLTGSLAYCDTYPTTDQTFTLYQNGTQIGSITFSPSPSEPTWDFPTAVTLSPGDILTLIGPSSPPADPHMTSISFTFVAILP